MGSAAATAWRRWRSSLADPYRLARPVISVGNLSVGGRGKTPLVALLARTLVAAGERPAILTRGYKRRDPQDGVVVVSDGTHVLADVSRGGDEPLMLALDAPGAAVLVCEQRALAGVLAEEVLGATVHLLDDGFQHLALARDADIVIVSAADLDDRVLPFGRLRESPRALSAADVVIVDAGAAGAAKDEVAATVSRVSVLVDRAAGGREVPVCVMHRTIGAPRPIDAAVEWPAGKGSVVALAGIASPVRFTASLEAAGWRVLRTLEFPDHHPFTADDVRDIARACDACGAMGVLTTAKDAARLLPLRPLPVPMAAVPLELSIEPWDLFRGWLFRRLAEARA